MTTNSAPEALIEIAEKELSTLEQIADYFSKKQMKRFRDAVRSVINEKTASLLVLKNHYVKPVIDKDLKDDIIDELEADKKKLIKRVEELLKIIEVNAGIQKAFEPKTDNEISMQEAFDDLKSDLESGKPLSINPKDADITPRPHEENDLFYHA